MVKQTKLLFDSVFWALFVTDKNSYRKGYNTYYTNLNFITVFIYIIYVINLNVQSQSCQQNVLGTKHVPLLKFHGKVNNVSNCPIHRGEFYNIF